MEVDIVDGYAERILSSGKGLTLVGEAIPDLGDKLTASRTASATTMR